MKKQNLQNERLDKIGRSLLKTAKMRNDEVEKVVTSSDLFNSVKAQIKAEEIRRERSKNQRFFPIWNWKKAGFAFGILAIILIGIIAVNLFTKTESTLLLAEQSEKFNSPKVELLKKKSPPQQIVKALSTSVQSEKRNFPKVAVSKPEPIKLAKSLTKTTLAKHQLRPKIEDDDKFYPLNLSYSSVNDINENLMIIRVDMTRTSLSAFGVKTLPNSGESKIKTDFLMGTDGIPQAYRLVKSK